MASRKETGTRKPSGGSPSATKPGSPHCPGAGDFIWIDFDPSKGHEQRGRRPAIVISPQAYNERARLCIASPVTRQPKGYPFEVLIPDGCGITGVVLADRVRDLAWFERNAALIGRAPAQLLDEVREKIAALIGV